MKCLTVVILIAVVTLYVLIGGAIFYALERDNESTTQTATYAYYYNFLSTYTCVSDTELQTFVRAIITAYDQGILATNTSSSGTQWDFANSAFFAMTCITTIGYGNQSPTTSGGRVFFVFYALFGIPLCVVLLGGIGLQISALLKKLKQNVWIEKHPKADNVLKTVVVVLIGLSILILVPSAIFSSVETWTYGEAIYYSVVSLTTVGFGDFVPGTDDTGYRAGYRFFIAVWLLIGLSWVAFILSEAGDWYKEFFEKREKKKVTDKDKENEDTEMTDAEKGEKIENGNSAIEAKS